MLLHLCNWSQLCLFRAISLLTVAVYLAVTCMFCQCDLSPPGYSVKSIIDPQACVNMHNHYCWSYTAGSAGRPTDVDVEPHIATSRHYKRCHFDASQCAVVTANTTKDDVMLRFRDQFQQQVDRRIALFNLSLPTAVFRSTPAPLS